MGVARRLGSARGTGTYPANVYVIEFVCACTKARYSRRRARIETSSARMRRTAPSSPRTKSAPSASRSTATPCQRSVPETHGDFPAQRRALLPGGLQDSRPVPRAKDRIPSVQCVVRRYSHLPDPPTAGGDQKRRRRRTHLGRKVLPTVMDIDADPEAHVRDPRPQARHLGENPGDLPVLKKDIVRPFETGADLRHGMNRLRHGEAGHQREERGLVRRNRGAQENRRVDPHPRQDAHTRPSRPRPLVCRSARTAKPSSLPSCPAAITASLVEPISGRTVSSRPMTRAVSRERMRSGEMSGGSCDISCSRSVIRDR